MPERHAADFRKRSRQGIRTEHGGDGCAFRKILAGRIDLLRQPAFDTFPPQTADGGQPLVAVGILRVERRDHHRALLLQRRVEQLHGHGAGGRARRRRCAAVRQAHVVVDRQIDGLRRVGVVEPGADLVTAAERLRNVVLPVRADLQTAAIHHLLNIVCARANPRRRIGQHLLVRLEIQREVDAVVAQTRVGELTIGDDPVP